MRWVIRSCAAFKFNVTSIGHIGAKVRDIYLETIG